MTGLKSGKFDSERHDRENLELIIKNADFMRQIELGMRLCGGLKIDFAELFGNENICESGAAGNFNMEKSAEQKYSLLNPSARRKTLEYINNILKS